MPQPTAEHVETLALEMILRAPEYAQQVWRGPVDKHWKDVSSYPKMREHLMNFGYSVPRDDGDELYHRVYDAISELRP